MIPDSHLPAPALHRFLHEHFELDPLGTGRFTCSRPRNPVLFFNRHLAVGHQLKRVEHAAWIPQQLARLCEDAIIQFTEHGHSFDETSGYKKTKYGATVSGANSEDVAAHHVGHMAARCNAYASKLMFNPKDPTWFSFVQSNIECSPNSEHSFNLCGTTTVVARKTEILQTLDEWALSTIDRLSTVPSLFNFEFFAKNKDGERLLRSMVSSTSFKWEAPTTTGVIAMESSHQPPLDSPFLKSLFPSLKGVPTNRTSQGAGPSLPLFSVKRSSLVAPSRHNKDRDLDYRINPNHYIQKAWYTAVVTDATFILFSCGTLQRIGIRHRGSQTLFLSDVIDTMRWSSLGFGQIHLGLVLAAIRDRLSMINEEELLNRHSSRRTENLIQRNLYNAIKNNATRPQQRISNPVHQLTSTEMDKKFFNDELARRDMVFLFADFGVHQSPAPSAFRRMEPSCVSRLFNSNSYNFKHKPSYSPDSYISATINQTSIGEGSMGVAYKTIVEVETSSGTKYQRGMVIKLATGDIKEKIINEYEVYKQLASRGVTRGIIGTHGLFHDTETGAMLMLMDDAGNSLADRYNREGAKTNGDGEPALVSDKERNELDGEFFIIDFDWAEHRMYISQAMFEEDQEALQESLEVE
ncbi:hypothetical protein JR316_0013367 [Psilocybe cubensis]|uniref:Uncharacterized protein n=1 Tax=Psilocybe cubensis TaxID=181762 RepID=A0ACB8GHC7_PSICU|nr:hypothetical protein JR316_0013367 [Psilocybe cubensis]KAH9474899.1 hypothetical protein JR316_0013367 [Psilocybe cubensis]